MMHTKRVWTCVEVKDAGELWEKLTTSTWTLCTGWRWRSLVLVNDSTGENGAQEYAVLKDGRQVESLTVSWGIKREKFIDTLSRLDADPEDYWQKWGGLEKNTGKFEPNLNHPSGTCWACA